MTQYLKQSTAVTVKIGPFVDDGDGFTALTSLTIAQADIRLTKNGGAFAQTNNATGATHDENGYYGVPLDTTDTGTLGTLRVAVSESGALPVWQDFMVVPANVWDSLFGADKLQVDAVEVSGDSAAADNAEAFFDGTGYAGTNNVIPTVTTVATVTTLAAAAFTKIADVVLRRSLASALASGDGDAKSFRSLAGAIAKMVNKVAIVSTTLTVYETDDTTALGTQTVVTSAAADPITSLDTA
jgi:hypothetical protein